MPDIVLKLARNEAVNTFSLIAFLKGGAGQKEQRAVFQKAIIDAWPEIEDAAAITAPGAKRKVPFTSKQQRAIAEGILAFCNDPLTRGSDYTNARAVAETCRVGDWVGKHIIAQESPDFEGALDGEPDLVDKDPAEAIPAPAAGAVPIRPRDADRAQEGPQAAAPAFERPGGPDTGPDLPAADA